MTQIIEQARTQLLIACEALHEHLICNALDGGHEHLAALRAWEDKYNEYQEEVELYLQEGEERQEGLEPPDFIHKPEDYTKHLDCPGSDSGGPESTPG